ncbi:MAG: glycosyltransferase family 9 protein, partial [Deltaproteobacteria bacterium]|nr:glycosyltransferase family 9 protein [Deltaproteobacteria bacterium]
NAAMKNIIILNLTRMGDLIQSTSLFKKIKLVYPESRVTMLISSDFAEIAPFLPYIDEIKPIDLTGLSELLKSNNFEFTVEVLKAVNAMFDGILSVKYDLAVNLSHDEFSVYFLYILNSLKNIGIYITREGTIISNDKMIAYMFSAVKNRKVSVLNLVDIYERCLNSGDKIHVNKIFLDTENINNGGACDVLKENGIDDDDILISFAIGASTSLKKWRYDYFAELAKMLLADNPKIKIILLGAKYDVEAGNYIENSVADGRLINLTGKTSVSDLVYLVKRCRLLITHDTGTMHIGVAAGIKLIVIYTGNVGFWETGPYSANQVLVVPDIGCFPCDFNLKCLNPVCKSLIKPEYIYDIAEMILGKIPAENYRQILSKYKSCGIIPYISRLDSKKFIDYLPAVKGKLNSKDLKLKILKTALEHFYEEDFWKIDENEIELFLDCFGAVEYNLSLDISEELKVVDNMIALCGSGMAETKKMVDIALNDPFDTDRINGTTGNIKSIDFELKYLSSVYDDLSLFNQIHVINQSSSASYDLFGLAVDSLKSYSRYKLQLNVFKRVSLMFLDKINDNFNYKTEELI